MQAHAAPLSPEEFVNEVERVLPQCTPKEQVRLIEHAKAWAIVRYSNEEIPESLMERLQRLEGQCRSLMTHAAG